MFVARGGRKRETELSRSVVLVLMQCNVTPESLN